MTNPNFFSDPGYVSNILSSTLAENINIVQNTILLTNATNFPSKGKIMIGTETIIYDGKTDNSLNNCYRVNPVEHNIGTSVILIDKLPESPIQYYRINSGWYKERGSSNKTLRVGDSNLLAPGTIRFNESTTTFQGFNGSEWVTFNAIQGPQGDPGENASQLFNFINLPNDPSNLGGKIFQSSGTTSVYFRSIQGGVVDINAGLTALSLSIINESDYVKITPQPQPYVWDFTSNNTFNNFKTLNVTSSTKLKAYGTIGKWRVKSNTTIKTGMGVRIVAEDSNMVIEPFTYTSNDNSNPAINQIKLGFLGIALENKSNGESCEVCTNGITMALIGNNADITGGIPSTASIRCGMYAFANYDGSVFSPTNILTVSPTHLSNSKSFFSIAGYWVEEGSLKVYYNGSIITDNCLGLFYVQGGLNL
jgi:hypothetical protein